MPDLDYQVLRTRTMAFILQSRNDWQLFDSLAWRICGDPAMASVLAAVANSDTRIFVVHQEQRVKLTLEGIELATSLTESAKGVHQMAADAARAYAAHLTPIAVQIRDADEGRRVLERYLHALLLEDSDDDLRLTDDTPVQLRAADGHFNPGYVAGLSRDLTTIYVAFDYQVLATDLPAKLVIYRNRTWIDIADQQTGVYLSQPGFRNGNPCAGINRHEAENARVLTRKG